MNQELVLGYWDARGKAEPIRWLIRYLGEDFKELNPTRENWPARKVQIEQEEGISFPNLPYLSC